MKNASHYIETLGLQKHPEGGWYKEVYRSTENIPSDSLPLRFGGERAFSTSIYYLLEQHDFSAFHRIKSDEIWHFYVGGSLIIYDISSQGELIKHILGEDGSKTNFQVMISHGHWFAALPQKGTSFVLAGCTVAPGFNFSDFEMGTKESLIEQFSQHIGLIEAYSKV